MRNSFAIIREFASHRIEIEAHHRPDLDTWNMVIRLDGGIWDVLQGDDVLKETDVQLARAAEGLLEDERAMLDSDGQAAA